MARRGGDATRSVVALALAFCCTALFHSAEGIKFRMFPNLNRVECVGTVIPKPQWVEWQEGLEKARQAGKIQIDGRNATKEEMTKMRFRERDLRLFVGFLTESVAEDAHELDHPVNAWVKDSAGTEHWRQNGITGDQVNLQIQNGVMDPYYLCFEATANTLLEIDISYFQLNLPHHVGKAWAHRHHLTEAEIDDMIDMPTQEEMEYYANQDHVHELKLDVKNLGSTIYHTLYEQQHIRQIMQRQNKGVKSISKRTVFAGLLETIIICMSSILQVYFVRQLFKSKNIPTYV